MFTVGVQRGARKFGRTDHSGGLAELGGADTRQRAMPATGDRGGIVLARVVEEQRRRRADAAGDDDEVRIEDIADEGQTQSEPACEIGHDMRGHRITVVSGTRDAASGQRARIPGHLAGENRRRHRIGGEHFDRGVDQGRSAAIPFPATTLAARTHPSVGHHLQMSEFRCDTITSAIETALDEQCCTDPGADGDQHTVVGSRRRAEPVLRPHRGIGVVFENDR